jgi:hypothetical protein
MRERFTMVRENRFSANPLRVTMPAVPGAGDGTMTGGAIQSDALTLRIFRDMAGFDHGGLLEISLRVR